MINLLDKKVDERDEAVIEFMNVKFKKLIISFMIQWPGDLEEIPEFFEKHYNAVTIKKCFQEEITSWLEDRVLEQSAEPEPISKDDRFDFESGELPFATFRRL